MLIKKLVRYCRKHDKVYCYGAGRYGREVCVYLEENGIKLDGFIVSSGQILKVLNIEVFRFSDMKIEKDVGIIVAVGTKYADEIIKAISERKVSDYFLVNDELLSEIEEVTEFSSIYPNNQFVNVLLYHRVADIADDFWNISVSSKHFDEQMRWLSDNFPIISFGDDFEKVSEPSFVITFDDGYADNYDIALPILKKYNIPATFFISSGLLGGKCFWWDELYAVLSNNDKDIIRKYHAKLKKMNVLQRNVFLKELNKRNTKDEYIGLGKGMSIEQIKQLACLENIIIGSHTVTHPSLACLSLDEQIDEIKGSIVELESLLQKKIEVFSYPHGDFNIETLEILKDLGIKKAATVAGGLIGKGDCLLIPRNIVLDQGIDSFKRFVNRCFCVYSEVRD